MTESNRHRVHPIDPITSCYPFVLLNPALLVQIVTASEKHMVYTEYKIEQIHTSTRHPGIVYACITLDGDIIVSATLDYCCKWIENHMLALDFE